MKFSASKHGSRNANLGGGQYLVARNVDSAEECHTDGLYWKKPWDLTEFGAPGATIIAATGYRYVWFWSSDHWSQFGWERGNGIYIGWSNDIARPPTRGVEVIAHTFVIGGHNYEQIETPWLIWKVEDATDPFRLYGHAVNTSVNQQNTIVYKSADLLSWTRIGISHQAAGNGGHHAGYQQVYRAGLNDYWSVGLNGGTTGTSAIWTSSDAETFTLGSNISSAIGNRRFIGNTGPIITFGGQEYIVYKEEGTHASILEGTHITLVPVTVTEGTSIALPADTAGNVRLSNQFGANGSSNYPDRDYLQSVEYAYEDGIVHMFPKRGFFSDEGLVSNADWANGGGLDNQLCDYYAYVLDETTARTSAPAGVRASATAGTVTLDWYDILPQNTYRIYRDTNADLSTKTLVGDVTGVRTTDTPGGTGTYYYEVMTLDSGTERQSRVVAPYVSSSSSLVNDHVARVIADGGDVATVDRTWLALAEDTLGSIGIKTDDLLFWAQPEFGHVKDGLNVLSKCYCLGSTIHPRGGDLTFATANSTYSATGWNSLPAWTAATGTAQSYFGGGYVNNIRRAHYSGLTVMGGIQRAGTGLSTLLASGEFTGFRLQVTSGSPGSARLQFSNTTPSVFDTDVHGTTLTNGTSYIVGGVITQQRATVYLEGVAGNGVAIRQGTGFRPEWLKGSRGSTATTPILVSGCASAKMNAATTTATRSYSFANNEAQYACRFLLVIKRALSESQMLALNTALRAGP